MLPSATGSDVDHPYQEMAFIAFSTSSSMAKVLSLFSPTAAELTSSSSATRRSCGSGFKVLTSFPPRGFERRKSAQEEMKSAQEEIS